MNDEVGGQIQQKNKKVTAQIRCHHHHYYYNYYHYLLLLQTEK